MDSKTQYFVHPSIFACQKLDLTTYYCREFLFTAGGTLLASKALTKINTFACYDGCSSDSH